jgi:hypothetical protein
MTEDQRRRALRPSESGGHRDVAADLPRGEKFHRTLQNRRFAGEPIRDCLPLTTILHALVRGHCCHDASLLDAALGPDAIDAIVATLAV